MPDIVKLAFIGSGGIVKSHLDQGLKDFQDVQFVGWCDLNPAVAEERREQVGGQGEVFSDAAEMLEEVKPDAVYIMLPPFAHGEAEDLVLERRLPFFVEKPVAIDLDTARRVYDGVQKHDLVTAVGYMNRYRKGLQRARAILAQQKPVFLHGGWVSGGPQKYEGIWKWWVQKDKSGGQFLEQTTHTIDLARYLFGDVEELYAVAIRDRKPRPDFYTIEDASMVQLRFKNGAAGTLYSSCSTDLGSGVTLTVFGTEMRAEFNGWDHSASIHLPGGEVASIPGEPNIFSLEDRAFIDAVKSQNREGLLATYEDGLKATAIACAANESMKTGQVVKLDI